MTCPSCGQKNPAGARFCNACGAALPARAPGLSEERKVVTILFVDLVGFTARAERLDPEDVRAIQTPYFARVREELEAGGGTVEKFIGDAVMAVFGAPVAHGDDAERAVRAALAIRSAVEELNASTPDLDLQVRLAVNTGEALVSLTADAKQGEGVVSGDVVNTASRLQQAAPVNGILVGDETYRATRSVIEYAAADAIVAKGKQAPISAWQALDAPAPPGDSHRGTRRRPSRTRGRRRAADKHPEHRRGTTRCAPAAGAGCSTRRVGCGESVLGRGAGANDRRSGNAIRRARLARGPRSDPAGPVLTPRG